MEGPLKAAEGTAPATVDHVILAIGQGDLRDLLLGYLTCEHYLYGSIYINNRATAVIGMHYPCSLTLKVICREIKQCRIGVNTVIHVRAVRKRVSERNLEEQAGDIHISCGVNVVVGCSVAAVIQMCRLKRSAVPLVEVYHHRTVAGIIKLNARDDLLTVIGKPGLALTAVDRHAVLCVALGNAVIVTGLAVMVIKRSVIDYSCYSIVYSLFKLIYRSIPLGIGNQSHLKPCLTEKVHPARLGVAVNAEMLYIKAVSIRI